MATPVEAPKLGNTVEECLLAKWRKQKGEPVSAGDVIADIETDKATFELTAPVNGTLLATFFPEGALVPVFTNLCVIGEPGESTDEFRPAPAGPVQAQAEPAKQQVQELRREPVAARTSSVVTAAPAAPAAGQAVAAPFSPRARRFADEHDFHPAGIRGSGPSGRVLEQDLRDLYFSSPRPSFAARRRMEEGATARGEGSGPGGRIMASDLGPAGTPIPGIREKIARRMRESLSGMAQYTMNASADASGLLALRARFAKGDGGSAVKVTIGDLVAYCVIQTLLEFPDLNAEFIDGKMYRHSSVHLGFACDTPRGLLVPVVRNAHQMTIQELAQSMKTLAKDAIDGQIALEDLSGATFTVSNLGALGIESFTPLINPPQVAILGVDAIQLKPVRRDGKVEFIDTIGFSITCDHQVIDGAPGARFLKAVREKIENVESLCTI